MMLRGYMFLSILLFAAIAGAQDYQSYVQEIEAKWNEYSQSRQFEEFQRQQDVAFQQFQQQQQEAYRQYVEEIERKWNEFLTSNKKEWVDYDEGRDTRSVVNFEEAETPGDEKGQVTVEAVVPADAPDALQQARELIGQQVQRLFSAANEARQNILANLVKNRAGEVVTPQNVESFVQEEVLPQAKPGPQLLPSKDGVERIKITVVIPMVPEHLRIRAEQYLPPVRKQCTQYKEPVPLVMSVIQTESYFNPLAKSHIPAYGLMQLVPKSGGRDAYRYVYQKDKSPSPEFLYVPENNLLLGTAYLHLIKERYLYGIQDPVKKEYLAIAAYNGGIGRVIRRVLKRYNVPELSAEEVYEALRKEMPDETKDYLVKVTSRKKNYKAWEH